MNLLKRLFIITCAYFLSLTLLVLLLEPHFIFRPWTDNSRDLVDSQLRKLALCESSGNPKALHENDGAIGLHSYGILQFQIPTFTIYWRNLINGDVEEEEIGNLYADPDNQFILAKAMIQKDRNNFRHWKNCSKKLNFI